MFYGIAPVCLFRILAERVRFKAPFAPRRGGALLSQAEHLPSGTSCLRFTTRITARERRMGSYMRISGRVPSALSSFRVPGPKDRGAAPIRMHPGVTVLRRKNQTPACGFRQCCYFTGFMWLVYAFSGPIFWAISTHIDKYLVDKYFRNADTTVLMLFTAFIGVALLPVIAFFDSGVLRPGALAIAVMTVSGILYMGAMLFYLRAIQSEEASVVAALFQVNTLFTFLMAWLFLHETLGWDQGAGCALIVGGAVVLSLDRDLRPKNFKARLVILMLAATFVLGFSSVLFKFFAVRDDYWTVTFWNFRRGAVRIGNLGCAALPQAVRRLVQETPRPRDRGQCRQ